MQLISLSKGKSTKVDDSDYKILKKFKWHFAPPGYARRHNGLGKNCILMHRQILNLKSKNQCDHINGDGLDNRKKNLRECLPQENYKNRRISINNTSGFKGVSWHKVFNKWQASITVQGRLKFLGRFKTAKDAANAYNSAAKKFHGEFAKLNKI